MRNPQLQTLLTMLTYCRPMGSPTETAFVGRYIASLPNAEQDPHGNYHVSVEHPDGTPSRVLWSCHTDTVHDDDGRQTVAYDPRLGIVHLSRRSARTSRCLGADDTAGIFILREMILASVPGHYVFHYGEERGGIGSHALAYHNEDWLREHFDCAIALDRRGTRDVITRQGCGRTASDAFANSLADALGMRYKPNEYGLYTDTAEYADIIPECSNLSVGYQNAHSNKEYLDTDHVFALLRALITLDQSSLVIARDPTEVITWSSWDDAEYDYNDYTVPAVIGPATSDDDWWYQRTAATGNNGHSVTRARNESPLYLDPAFEAVQRELSTQLTLRKGNKLA